MMAGQGHQVSLQEKQVGDLEMPDGRREAETLFQEQPKPGNQYLEDALLRSYLEAHLPPKVLEEVSQELERFGNRLLTKIRPLGWECELNPPVFQQYDAWGQRVDHIITCSAWKRMKEIAAEEGLIAEAYERRYSNWSRVHQAVKLYLFSTASGGFNCPLAMTDGAAKVIEVRAELVPEDTAHVLAVLAKDRGELICLLALDVALPCSVTQLHLPPPDFLLQLQSVHPGQLFVCIQCCAQ